MLLIRRWSAITVVVHSIVSFRSQACVKQRENNEHSQTPEEHTKENRLPTSTDTSTCGQKFVAQSAGSFQNENIVTKVPAFAGYLDSPQLSPQRKLRLTFPLIVTGALALNHGRLKFVAQASFTSKLWYRLQTTCRCHPSAVQSQCPDIGEPYFLIWAILMFFTQDTHAKCDHAKQYYQRTPRAAQHFVWYQGV